MRGLHLTSLWHEIMLNIGQSGIFGTGSLKDELG